jgi:hypothetical protein
MALALASAAAPTDCCFWANPSDTSYETAQILQRPSVIGDLLCFLRLDVSQ